MLRRTCAEIDLDAFAYNLCALRAAAGQTPMMACVKADAYGHGVLPVVKRALREGIEWFCVATPDEAVEITQLCRNILILSPIEDFAAEDMVRRGVRLCAFTKEQLAALKIAAHRTGQKARVHVKIDTGMGRVGLRREEDLLALLPEFDETLLFEGIFTHFATADEPDKTFAEAQLARFTRFVDLAKQAGFMPLAHCSNSAATICMPKARFNLVREGISMYGYPPSSAFNEKDISLRPVLKLSSRISFVKEIQPGDSVSYGRRFVAKRPSRIATVPIGYADGYLRANGCRSEALVGGRRVKIAGTVCMDQTMLDVTDVPGVKPGDEAVLLGRQGGEEITADELAKNCGTISYEILTSISKRVPRVYED